MSIRYRQIHNIWGVYAGESPASGYHYSDYNNIPHNNPSLSIFDNNLLHQIDRVQSFEYGFNIERQNITQLGVRGLVDRAIVNRPSIQVSFNYLVAGIRNENNLGLVVNYTNIYDEPVLENEVCCFKNFTGQHTDYRNLFVAISPTNDDLNNSISDSITSSNISPSNLFVFGFGNCYLNSYSIRAAVGDFPNVSIGYICDNVMGYSSGSGANIPAVYPQSGTLINNVKFTIPRSVTHSTPSVLRPGDIILKINDENDIESSDATWGILSSGLAIQAFDISVDLDREELRSIGYVLPVDRRINFPIFANINISSIIDNNYTGNLISVLNQNKNYNLLLNMYNPNCMNREISAQYKIKNVKFEGSNYSYDIGNNLIGNFAFEAEIDVDNSEKGFYISGLLNVDIPEFPLDYLALEGNKSGFLYTEDNHLIIISEKTLV